MKVSGVWNKKKDENENEAQDISGPGLKAALAALKKGSRLPVGEIRVKEGETSPPRRYTSGSMILAMENAGQLIEDEDLRAQIKGSGIGTSATRAEILKKLVTNQYLSLSKKTQVITPTLQGEMIYDTVNCSIRPLLSPELTASWELGLTRVAEGSVTSGEYMEKLTDFISRRTAKVKEMDHSSALANVFAQTEAFYRRAPQKGGAGNEEVNGTDNA